MVENSIEETLSESKDGVILRIEVTPNSKRVSFGYNKWRKAVEIKLRSPAKAGKANRELIGILSNLFGEAEILSGEKSRLKTVIVKGKKDEVLKKLKSLINQNFDKQIM